MELNKKANLPKQNRIKIIEKIRSIFCSIIREGTVQEIKLFYRWFKADLESPAWPVLKGPFRNIPVNPDLEPVFALKKIEDTDMFHAVLSLRPDLNVRDAKHDQMTILHCVVLADKILPAAMFLYYGCDPDARTKSNDRPVDKAISEPMRQMFRDFEQLDKRAFAIKYKLNVPNEEEERCYLDRFPFLDLPLEIQREVLLKLDPVDFFMAPLVCNTWKYWTSHRLNSFIPKLGNWKIRDGSGLQVVLKIQVFPTFFHFCQAHSFNYTPIKKREATRKKLWGFPKFEDFVRANGSNEEKNEIKLDRLRQLIFDEEFPTYWWEYSYMKHHMFIKLTDNGGLAIKWSLPYHPRNNY